MKVELKPTRYYKNIYTINYDLLKKENIKYLLFDLDNTIGDNREKTPSKEAIELFKNIKKDFTPIIISNALPWRAKKYAEVLEIDCYYLSAKPSKKNYNKIMKKYQITNKEIACIGDQIYTDIKGSNRLNITSIFVDRISKYESIFTKKNRLREKIFIYKKGIIKRGEYYE